MPPILAEAGVEKEYRQAMDAAGKDGIIKHVMSGVNPQGCQVASFKAPTYDELVRSFGIQILEDENHSSPIRK